jgi:outer membrane protein OmpA-like peptidoglycan-associated protein
MKNQKFNLLFTLMMGLALLVPAYAQNSDTTSGATRPSRMVKGQKQKLTGVIVKREADSFILRDQSGVDTTVTLTSATKAVERKSNPFRSAKNYGITQLVRGLEVEVEGVSDGSTLTANKIRFRDTDFRIANSIESRVTPVEGRVSGAETRITAAEQNAQRLSGQIEELGQVTNTLKSSTKAAQDTADAAVAGVNATNQRISMIDDYEPLKATTVNFKVNSSVLSPEAQLALDEIAGTAKTQKAFIIEVAGFASADGDADKNRMLSQRRADAVVRYLAETHMIPLRRIVTPFGYGAANPVGDNTSKEGREQNRRVEVRILVSKGLTAPVGATRQSTGE